METLDIQMSFKVIIWKFHVADMRLPSTDENNKIIKGIFAKFLVVKDNIGPKVKLTIYKQVTIIQPIQSNSNLNKIN